MPEFDKKTLDFLLNKYTPEYLEKEFPKHIGFVYEEDGKTVGLVFLVGNEVRWLYVLPEHQGKGYGRALMERIEKEAKEVGLKEVIARSYYGAKSFYEMLDYRNLGDDEMTVIDVTFYFVNMQKHF
jgi:GNAT superfamily N-acetyltransferase